MLKNASFKTFQGVPFEFALHKAASAATSTSAAVTSDAATTFTSLVAGSATGSFYLLRQNPTTGVVTAAKNDAAAATFRTGTYKSWPHQVAWCTDSATDKFYLSSQFIPEKCDPIERNAYAAAAAQVATISSSTIPIGNLQELSVRIIETTTGNLPCSVWDYTVVLSPSITEADAWTRIARKINYGSYTATSGTPKDGEWFTAVDNSSGLTVTASSSAANIGRTFKIVASLIPTKADTTDYGVVFTYAQTTAPTIGNGTFDLINDLYTEAVVRQGVGHLYTPAGYTATEMGLPVTLSTIMGSTLSTFDVYKIAGYRVSDSKIPSTGQQIKRFYIFIAADTVLTEAVAMYPFGGSTNGYL